MNTLYIVYSRLSVTGSQTSCVVVASSRVFSEFLITKYSHYESIIQNFTYLMMFTFLRVLDYESLLISDCMGV